MSVSVMPSVVPAYFHPLTAPADWRRLAAAGDRLRLVVLNIADGPGERRDPEFAGVVEPLLAAGVRVAGYVDTDYGRRPWDACLRDVERYRDWYGVRRAFLDQVAAERAWLPYYARLGAAMRRAGATETTLNPGVYPYPGYMELADLLVTFEGPWPAYRCLTVPFWVRRHPAHRFCHLVYAVPPLRRWLVARLAAHYHAGVVTITELGGANPWQGLPRHMTLGA
ncbi:hypothetical protein GCM10012275_29070 [Longimycelium tulufanense]|uniref:Spherulation-specific family 4 n=1 Tax=Longimycelium tulufanense TaxID=907463 RepID=A0A8J3FUL6_9PSEU|nr:spherulation-specific family 4 protein [Longimycelium tulufanense]GGM56148.1 hypothetical protein GCM10012275_29070 [Longimycelium tulufanense]